MTQDNVPQTYLKPYFWRVPSELDNAQLATGKTVTYIIGANLDVVLTNRVGGIPLDTWLIVESITRVEDGYSRLVYGYIDNKRTLTEALNVARRYAWAIYRVDITTLPRQF